MFIINSALDHSKVHGGQFKGSRFETRPNRQDDRLLSFLRAALQGVVRIRALSIRSDPVAFSASVPMLLLEENLSIPSAPLPNSPSHIAYASCPNGIILLFTPNSGIAEALPAVCAYCFQLKTSFRCTQVEIC